MARTLTFSFDQLPLVIDQGFEAGDVAGHAAISYHREGGWWIEAIFLDGKRFRGAQAVRDALLSGRPVGMFEEKSVELDAGDPIYLRIYHRLENEYRQRVQNKVIEALAADRDARPFDRADRRRKLESV